MIIDLKSPVEIKRAHIGQIFVQHPDVVGTREFLDQVGRTSFRLREMETAYVRGWSRCGKSETIKRWILAQTGQHVIPGLPVQLLEGNGLKIVFVDMTGSGATPMQLSQMIGSKLFGSEKILKLHELPVTDFLIALLDHNKVDIMFVDEAQNMLRSLGPKGAHKFAAWVLAIENARKLQLILVGAPFLELLTITIDAADARQAGSRVLKPFPFETAVHQSHYKSFAKGFAAELPFKSNWISESLIGKNCYETLYSLYYATRGRPGNFAKLCEHSTVMACVDGDSEVLTKEHFRAAFELRYLANSKYAGRNPFNDADYVLLPKIPLSVDQGEVDEQLKTFLRTASGQRKGGRLYEVSP